MEGTKNNSKIALGEKGGGILRKEGGRKETEEERGGEGGKKGSGTNGEEDVRVKMESEARGEGRDRRLTAVETLDTVRLEGLLVHVEETSELAGLGSALAGLLEIVGETGTRVVERSASRRRT